VSPRQRVRFVSALAAAAFGVSAAFVGLAGQAHAATPRVLRVGSYHGIAGTFTSVQQAVRAAHANDWVLVGPGDYKENGYPRAPEPAGVLITTPGLHLRGMNRNTVIIDGTKPGTPTCSNKKNDQIFTDEGRDGVQVLKVDGTYIDNLTACNYLTGNKGGEGNEIWWNGGDGSGKIGMGTFWGNYLTATSTYSNGVDDPRGEYGIFTSNSRGPASINHTYASNMGDAAYYIGACTNCNQVLDDAHGQFSALGYSGTNSGGTLTVENSEFDQNKSGVVSNSQNNDDAPSPQSGHCVAGTGNGPLGIGICSVWKNNFIHDNNNPNVPGAGAGSLAGSGPIGSGIVLAGTRFIAVSHNRIEHNGGWGVVVADLPDQEQPPTDIGENCQGGVYTIPPGTPGQDPLCWFDVIGNAIIGNSFKSNGFFGNPTNGDIGYVSLGLKTNGVPGLDTPGNCFTNNTDPAGLTSDPPSVQSNPLYDTCPALPNSNPEPLLTSELLCATSLLAQCPPNVPEANYPQTTAVVLHMPPAQPTMPDPCAGVPVNPWCPAAASASPSRVLPATGLHALLPIGALVVLAAGGAVAVRRLRAS
jgi:hypothetical protein